MRDGTLTHAWTRASAALPLEWQLMGVVRGPWGHRADTTRFTDAVLSPDTWVAWAKGPRDGDEAAGTGQSPEAALYRLAARLAERRGSMGGSGTDDQERTAPMI